MDRAKRHGAPSQPVEAAALPVPHDPVFRTDFSSLKAATGQEGRLVGRAVLDDQALDTRQGGWIAYPGEELFQAGAPLTVAMRVNLDRIEGIPVLISFGHWEGPGWWIQLIGGQIRFYLPVQKILDAGALPLGGWHHLAATYDGTTSRLFVDGVEVGHRDVGPVDTRPWPGELRIGMYSDDAAMYQPLGRIDDVTIWRRALPAAEIRALRR
ncbi:MAG: LamG domain-containing protein [Verrucomicrobia bacterium]|nr:LamG domain-containing protein [Verrucomicrobiota bacterium]